VERLCDKLSIIRQGKTIEAGSLEEMRHLTRNTMVVQTKTPAGGLSAVKGVHDLQEKEGMMYFQVDGEELDNVIRYISPLGIVKLESAPVCVKLL
jgi:ABC-2 type transport system ATP-binding protein